MSTQERVTKVYETGLGHVAVGVRMAAVLLRMAAMIAEGAPL
jgi:hypothetical protein